MQLTVNLPANQWVQQATAGDYFVLLDTGAVSAVELRFCKGTLELESVRTARRGLKARTTIGFSHIYLRAASATAVEVVISDGAVDVDTIDGSTVNVTAATPLPVSNDRGSPGNLLYVSGVTVADAPATSIANVAPVACSSVIATIAAVNAARRAVRFTNLGPDPVAIGAAGLTWANRCIVLEVGDTWNEDRAANLAWSAICDTAKTASVTRQDVIA